MHKKLSACARCKISSTEKACMVQGGKGPVFCPTNNLESLIKSVAKKYQEAGTLEFARQASIQEAECYVDRENNILHPVKPRLQEIIEFAGKMGYKTIGLTFCAGLSKEASALDEVLKNSGFNVVSVCCKVGCVPKEELGLNDFQKVRQGRFESMCNPVAQAEILNEAKTDFNILLGLCVGHDSLFFKNALAPTTVFAVKDRVLAHNPLGSIYTLHTYYQRFRN